MEKCFFSGRIYKKDLPQKDVSAIQDTLLIFNKAKHTAYKLFLDEYNYNFKYGISIHIQIKNRYGLDDYFANSAIQAARAVFSSQKELNSQYQKDLNHQIKSRQKKVQDIARMVNKKEKVLTSLVNDKFKTYPGAREFKKGNIYGIRYKKHTRIFFNSYDFEHQYLRPEIKKLKHRIKMIEFSIERKTLKLEKLKSHLTGVTFGTKKLFKAQHTKKDYINNHPKWLDDFRKARYSSMQISGRKDAKFGNFVFKYDWENKLLEIGLPKDKITIKDIDFPYGQEHVDNALINRSSLKKPVAWEIVDKGDYYIFKVVVHVPPSKNVNYSKEDGLIGVDINYDHLAVVEIDRFGNILDKKTLRFNLLGKTTGQSAKIIENAAIQLVRIADNKNKPIVLEDLNTTDSKSKLAYGNKKANRKITQFAYKKITDSIKSRAHKFEIAVFLVNPAYTSQIGKFKYMKPKGLSVHLAAAYVIARRRMGFSEKVPPILSGLLPEKIAVRHHWAHWSCLTRTLKDVKPHALYQELRDMENISSLKDLKNQLELTGEGDYLMLSPA